MNEQLRSWMTRSEETQRQSPDVIINNELIVPKNTGRSQESTQGIFAV